MTDRRTEKIGALVLLLGLSAATAVVVHSGADGRDAVRLRVYLAHAGPLSAGDPVIVAGRNIGRVEAISLVPGERAGPGHPLEKAGGAILHVGIDTRYRDWTSIDSELFMGRRGVFGRPYLASSPPTDGSERGRPLRDGDRVRGVDPPRLDRVLRRATAGAIRVRAVAAEVEPAIRQLGAQLGRLGDALRAAEPRAGAYGSLAENLASAGSELGALAGSLTPARPPSPKAVARVLARAAAASSRARTELDAAAAALDRAGDRIPPDARARVRAAVDDARASLAGIERIASAARGLAQLVAEGRGTIGAILNDPAFSQDAKAVGRELLRHPWRVLDRPPDR